MTGRTWQLLGPSVRAAPFSPTLVAFALGLLLVAAAGGDGSAAVPLPRLRGVALLFAVAVAFAMDDPTEEVADATATPRWQRAAARAAVQAVPALVLWLVVLAAVAARVDAALPAGALVLEAAGMTFVGWAAASWWRRARGVSNGGAVAGPVLIAWMLAAHRLPSDLALFAPVPGTPLWNEAQRRWLVLLLAAALLLGLALRDPLSGVHRPCAHRR